MRKFGFSWSWKRASGLSAAKGKLSRAIGIPLTRSGRQRKIGRAVGVLGLGLLGLGRSTRQSVQPLASAGQQTCGQCGHTWAPRGGKLFSPRCPNCGTNFTNVTVRGNNSGCIGCIGLFTVIAVALVIGMIALTVMRNDAATSSNAGKSNTVSTIPQNQPSPVIQPVEQPPSTQTEIPADVKPEKASEPVAETAEENSTPKNQDTPVGKTESTARPLRMWHDSSGSFSSNARLKSVANGKVHLVKEDGSEIVVPKERLSEDDQAYIKDQMK